MTHPENNQGPDVNSEKLHEELAGSRVLDRGIELFESRMLQKELGLSIAFAKLEKGFDSIVASGVEKELNDEWCFHEKVALLSGRIYVTDPDISTDISEAWGSALEDEKGFTYYEITDVQLRSHGVEVIPLSDDDDDEKNGSLISNNATSSEGVRIGYVFSAPGDEYRRPLFSAYPGELSSHLYEHPTPEAARVLLADRWPGLLAVIDTLTKPGNSDTLPARMAMLARKIQKELKVSSDFAELVDIYINDRVKFNKEAPYVTTIHNKLSYFDGDDINTSESDDDWEQIAFEDPQTVALYKPRIHFFEQKNGSIAAYFIGATYNDEFGESDPEHLCFAVEDITMFRSTIAPRSIASRALLGIMVKDGSREEGCEADMATIISEGALLPQTDEDQRESFSDSKPEIIQRIEVFLGDLRTIAASLQEAQKVRYKTKEAAADASLRFIIDVVKPLLNRNGSFTQDFLLQFNGPGVELPNLLVERVKDAKGSNASEVRLTMSSEEPLKRLDDGDSFDGLIVGVLPLFIEQCSPDNEVLWYSIVPSMEVSLRTIQATVADRSGVETVRYSVEQKALLPMDGTVNTTAQVYEDFMSMKEAFVRASEAYKKHPVMSLFYKLQEALLGNFSHDFIELRHPSMVQDVGRSVDAIHAIEASEKSSLLVTLARELFVSRYVGLSGELYKLDGDSLTRIEEEAVGDEEGLINGHIIDVQPNVVPGTLSLTLKTYTGELLHVPLRTISRFRF